MKKHSCVDYATYTLFKSFGACMRKLPLPVVLSLGRALGGFLYLADFKHRYLVYAHLKIAFGTRCDLPQLKRLTKSFYLHFGQSLIEIFLIPRINREYLDRYITIEGKEHIEEAFQRNKGVIFCGIHEGSWELYNVITANLGFPFHFMVGDLGERFEKVVELLNEYRRQKGCRLIYRRKKAPPASASAQSSSGVRRLIEILRANEAVGMSIDQGGKTGLNVPFFGCDASMSTGAVRLALKYDAVIVPSFIYRRAGSYNTIVLEAPFTLIKSGDPERDVRVNLERLVAVFEKHVAAHPQEYLWTYKVWKYSRQRQILIVDDGKAGHLRQSQAVAGLAQKEYSRRGLQSQVETAVIGFKSGLWRSFLKVCAGCAGRYSCTGCGWCVRHALTPSSYCALSRRHYDVVISCGSSGAAVNYMVSRQNRSRSVVLMNPGFFSLGKFDLVIVPSHDRGARGKNVVKTEGALNLIDPDYLRAQAEELAGACGDSLDKHGEYVGILLGGDAKGFCLNPAVVRDVLRQVKAYSLQQDARILITTSRRSSAGVEDTVIAELGTEARCALCLIANRKNIPSAVGGILGLSAVIICSAESISMISEAVSSGKYVIVFGYNEVSAKHRRFLRDAAEKKSIYLCDPADVKEMLVSLSRQKPAVRPFNNNEAIVAALSRTLS